MAGEILSAYHNGRPGLRHEVRAASEVKKLGQAVEPREVIVTALAMYLMLYQDVLLHRPCASRTITAVGSALP